MTELANLLPAMIAALLGAVALISAHVSKRHLEARQRASREADGLSLTEPMLPMTGIEAVKMGSMVVSASGGEPITTRPIKGTLFERMSSIAREATTVTETRPRRRR